MYASLRGFEQSQNHTQQCGLPATVGTDDGDEVIGLDLQADGIEDRTALDRDTDVGKIDDGIRHLLHPRGDVFGDLLHIAGEVRRQGIDDNGLAAELAGDDLGALLAELRLDIDALDPVGLGLVDKLLERSGIGLFPLLLDGNLGEIVVAGEVVPGRMEDDEAPVRLAFEDAGDRRIESFQIGDEGIAVG